MAFAVKLNDVEAVGEGMEAKRSKAKRMRKLYAELPKLHAHQRARKAQSSHTAAQVTSLIALFALIREQRELLSRSDVWLLAERKKQAQNYAIKKL